MRFTILTLIPVVTAFAPNLHITPRHETQLKISRRDAVLTGAALAGLAFSPKSAAAFSQQMPDNWTEPTQMPTDGRLDLNSAYVGDYKQLRGMFPTTAGKIASNGPYKTVKDVYKIKGLTSKSSLDNFRDFIMNFISSHYSPLLCLFEIPFRS